jgi:hypothetical protein
MNILPNRRRKRGWVEFVDIVDFRPNPMMRVIAWGARRAWAIRHPDLAAKMRRRMQWWKDVEQFPGPVYGFYDDFMELQLTYARAQPEPEWITFGFQREAMRPTKGVWITTWRKSLMLDRLMAERANFPVRATVFEAAVALGPKAKADSLLLPDSGDALDLVQLKALRTISTVVPGFPGRTRVDEALGLGIIVLAMQNEKTTLVLAARELEMDQLERLTRHIGIVQEHVGLLDKYRVDFRARQRELGYVVDY